MKLVYSHFDVFSYLIVSRVVLSENQETLQHKHDFKIITFTIFK